VTLRSEALPIRLAPPLSEEGYAKSFNEYKKISAEWDAVMRWIEDSLLGDLPDKPAFSVLSIGSGSGDFDMRFIQLLKSRFPKLDYVGLEPNEVHCKEYRARIAAQHIQGVHAETHCIPFEEARFTTQFDLIHFTHSLYYLKDRQQAILHAIDITKPSGRVLIVHQTPQGIYEIQRAFMLRLKGDTNEMFSSENLRELLEESGIQYDFEILDSCIDVTDLDFSSEPGQDLINFFLECDVSRVVPAIREEIVNYVRSLSFEHHGHRVISHPIGIFSIRKQRRE
jgi:SAM-dependent methyltransferase